MSTTDPRLRPTVRQYTGDPTGYADDVHSGWVLFAAIVLGMLGILNVIDGIAAVSSSTFFVEDAKYVLAGLNTWGWVMLAAGVIQALTAIGVWVRARGARWVGVAIATLNACAQMLMLPAYPLWSLAIFTLDMLVIYGLVAHGARERG
ncbi:MAG TPA: hypothetical protein VFG79_00415 [Solirubrobacter sp.]|jgi:hypothetical protein|nr:hypothetical protein [Solirubrobacter sp.]